MSESVAAAMAAGLARVAAASSEPEVAAARGAGEAVRQVIVRLTATSAPPDVLAEVAGRLDGVLDLLGPYSAVRRYRGSSEGSGLAHDSAFFDWSPVLGLANPVAPPLRVSVEGTIVVGLARFGLAYEGPPGCVHGGFVAAAFDEVLGVAQCLSGRVGMTATLTVRYRRPTPLHTDLRFEGSVEAVAGRKVTVAGRLLAGEELTAEATALFITISPERFAALQGRRDSP